MLTYEQLTTLGADKLAKIILQTYKFNKQSNSTLDILCQTSDKYSYILLSSRLETAIEKHDKNQFYVKKSEFPELIASIEFIRINIIDNLAPQNPKSAFDVMVKFIKLHYLLLQRVKFDEEFLEIFKQACQDLATIAQAAGISVADMVTIAQTILDRSLAGVGTELIIRNTEILKLKGLVSLQGYLETYITQNKLTNRYMNYSFHNGEPCKARFEVTLKVIADLLQDPQAYTRACSLIGEITDENYIEIIARMIKYGKPKLALQQITYLEKKHAKDLQYCTMLQSFKIEALTASGNIEMAQKERLSYFSKELSPKIYNQILQYINPTERITFQQKALQTAMTHTNPVKVANFLLHINNIAQLGQFMMKNLVYFSHKEFHELPPIGQALVNKEPLAALVVYRRMIELMLADGDAKYTKQIIEYLLICKKLSSCFADSNKEFGQHDKYLQSLEKNFTSFKYRIHDTYKTTEEKETVKAEKLAAKELKAAEKLKAQTEKLKTATKK